MLPMIRIIEAKIQTFRPGLPEDEDVVHHKSVSGNEVFPGPNEYQGAVEGISFRVISLVSMRDIGCRSCCSIRGSILPLSTKTTFCRQKPTDYPVQHQRQLSCCVFLTQSCVSVWQDDKEEALCARCRSRTRIGHLLLQ